LDQQTLWRRRKAGKWGRNHGQAEELHCGDEQPNEVGAGYWPAIWPIPLCREGEWSPRLIAALVLLGLFLVLLLLLLWFILSALFLARSTYSFWLYPPLCEECQKRAGSSYRPPSKLFVHLYSPAQAHFELVGNAPFKSNSFSAIDFDTVGQSPPLPKHPPFRAMLPLRTMH
jgi:hypothetical protein